MKKLVFSSLILLLFSANSYSQAVTNPLSVEFESPGHWGVLPDGQPEIVSYVIELYLYNPTMGLIPQLQSSPFSKSLGMVVNGTTPPKYKYSLAVIGLFIPPGPLYVAKIKAIGSGTSGSSWSEGFSNQFSSNIPLPTPTPVNPPEPASGFTILR